MSLRLAVYLILAAFVLSGCGTIEKARKADELEAERTGLLQKMAQLEKEKKTKVSDLERAKKELEVSLKKEIGEYQAKLKMTERGLVITFLSEVFFDSGKDKVKSSGKASLDKVADVLKKDVPVAQVAVEGHTDNDPIVHSGWKSNWELSSARALAVLHYLTDECGIEPARLSANGYGEYQPVAPNDTTENKEKNRRVEIVILPSNLSKVKAE